VPSPRSPAEPTGREASPLTRSGGCDDGPVDLENSGKSGQRVRDAGARNGGGIQIRLRREKETKRCWRYQALDLEADDAPVWYAYVRKSAIGGDNAPQIIRMTIEAEITNDA
jgi:hypothetical protein